MRLVVVIVVATFNAVTKLSKTITALEDLKLIKLPIFQCEASIQLQSHIKCEYSLFFYI